MYLVLYAVDFNMLSHEVATLTVKVTELALD